jgi:membrane associated rhomboid family serine protease
LYQIGPSFENIFGPFQFLLIYLGSGICANCNTFLLNISPYSIGASSCIFGLYGAFVMEYHYGYKLKYRIDTKSIYQQLAINSLYGQLAANLVYGLSTQGVDNAAHVFGFLSGALLQLL